MVFFLLTLTSFYASQMKIIAHQHSKCKFNDRIKERKNIILSPIPPSLSLSETTPTLKHATNMRQ